MKRHNSIISMLSGSVTPLVILSLVISCGTTTLKAVDLAQSQTELIIRKSLVIGVDGMRPDQMTLANTPNIDALIANGAFSPTATNVWTPTNAYNGESKPNWGTLLTGVSPTRHGMSNNGDTVHSVDDDNHGSGEYRTLQGHLKQYMASIQTAVFYTWGGIGMGSGTILENSQTVVDHHFGGNTSLPSSSDDIYTTQAAIHAIGGKPGATVNVPGGSSFVPGFVGADPDSIFVHLSQVDAAGHSVTYDHPDYREAIERIDIEIGRMLDEIAQRPNIANEEWLVLVTADHGGESNSTGHANNNVLESRTIPFIISGDRIINGSDIGSPSIYDVTPTILEWHGAFPDGFAFDGQVVLPLTVIPEPSTATCLCLLCCAAMRRRR